MNITRTYLGDSVYAQITNGMLELTTDNGMGPTNTIYLEAEVVANLFRYIESWRPPHNDEGEDAGDQPEPDA